MTAKEIRGRYGNVTAPSVPISGGAPPRPATQAAAVAAIAGLSGEPDTDLARTIWALRRASERRDSRISVKGLARPAEGPLEKANRLGYLMS